MPNNFVDSCSSGRRSHPASSCTAAFFAKALGDIARAKGMSQIARDTGDTGLTCKSLYKALSRDHSPGFDTILEMIGALVLKLHGEASRGRRDGQSCG